jgi:hypothetical protein
MYLRTVELDAFNAQAKVVNPGRVKRGYTRHGTEAGLPAVAWATITSGLHAVA